VEAAVDPFVTGTARSTSANQKFESLPRLARFESCPPRTSSTIVDDLQTRDRENFEGFAKRD
jgi:hypothetical protein